jgi:methylmalonyl-CoA mutase C-terminal domain/subunit
MVEKKIRVLVAKPGLDGHDRGAKVVARHLRDAGFEVIYMGLRQRPEEIAAAADQEDVDVVGLSVLSGAHLPLARKVKQALTRCGLDHVKLVIGGTIPADDAAELKAAGADAIFPTGSRLKDIADYIRGVKSSA